MEIFKSLKNVVELGDKYEVTNYGNVYKLLKSRKMIRKIKTDNHGYSAVNLSYNAKTKTYNVHKLVMLAFVGVDENPERTYINHIDKDKTNNNIKNLEWCTNIENIRHHIYTSRTNEIISISELRKRDDFYTFELGTFDYKEYGKNYREKHKEKYRQYNAEYREKNKEKFKEYGVKFRENNKEKLKKYYEKYRKNNKDKISEYNRTHREKVKRLELENKQQMLQDFLIQY